MSEEFRLKSHLVTQMQGEYDGQHASGWVPPMLLIPLFMGVSEKRWVDHNHLLGREVR